MSEVQSLGGSVERQVWPEAESGAALWCLKRTEADEAVSAAMYEDGHADISLRLAHRHEQAGRQQQKQQHKIMHRHKQIKAAVNSLEWNIDNNL